MYKIFTNRFILIVLVLSTSAAAFGQGGVFQPADSGWRGTQVTAAANFSSELNWTLRGKTSRKDDSTKSPLVTNNTQWYISNRIMGFLEYLPRGYRDPANATKSWPLIIYSPGCGEMHNGIFYMDGPSNNKSPNYTIGVARLFSSGGAITAGNFPALPKELRDNGNYFSDIPIKTKGQKYDPATGPSGGAIVICLIPRSSPSICPADYTVMFAGDYEAAITKAKTWYRVDPAKVYITGMSAGAQGSWEYPAYGNNAKVAGVAPVAATTTIWSDMTGAANIVNNGTQVLVIANRLDSTFNPCATNPCNYFFPISYNRESANAVRSLGGVVSEHYFTYPTQDPNRRTHDAWQRGFHSRIGKGGSLTTSGSDPAPPPVYSEVLTINGINVTEGYTMYEWMMATTNSLILPVSFIDFTAQRVTGGVMLKWITAEEVNSGYYTIERSVDGRNFTKIGEVSASGTSSQEKRYSYLDENLPVANYVYYRLKQTDRDGRTETYKTRKVSLGAGAGTYKFYPTIATSGITLEFKSARTDVTTIRVIDAMGKQLATYTIPPRQIRTTFDVSFLSRGIYFVQISSSEMTSTEKFIKQ